MTWPVAPGGEQGRTAAASSAATSVIRPSGSRRAHAGARRSAGARRAPSMSARPCRCRAGRRRRPPSSSARSGRGTPRSAGAGRARPPRRAPPAPRGPRCPRAARPRGCRRRESRSTYAPRARGGSTRHDARRGGPQLRNRSKLFAQALERGPARIGRLLVVHVRLAVQVLAADGAETGAVSAAEDLVRQRERKGVARPRREVEVVVTHVWRSKLLRAVGVRRLILASRDRELEDGVVEAAVARPVQTGGESELEEGAGCGSGDLELSRNRAGHRQVALAAQLEGLELELDLVAVLLPRAEFQLSQIEALHRFQGSAASLSRSARRP